MRYQNRYIPACPAATTLAECDDLDEVFKLQKQQTFIINPEKVLKETRVTNFDIIYKKYGKPPRRPCSDVTIKNAIKKAEVVRNDHFENYSKHDKDKSLVALVKARKRMEPTLRGEARRVVYDQTE